MPRTRRSGHGPTTGGQSTISFKNRVTKPTDSTTALKNAKSLNAPAEEIVKTEIARQATPEPAPEPAVTSGKAKAEPVESPVRILPSPSRRRKVRRSAEDVEFQEARTRAGKISDAQIKKYWKAEEDERSAPRVHQKDVHLHEKILRHFDLCNEYGPCIGITRIKRWQRAQGMDLSPPIEVLAVLVKEEGKADTKGAKTDAGRIAYVDELGGTKEL